MNKLKSYILSGILFATVLGVVSCSSKEYKEKTQAEASDILKYVQEAGITDSLLSDSGVYYYPKSATGVYYVERKLGPGVAPEVGGQVSVRYTCYLLDDSVNYLASNESASLSRGITFYSSSTYASFPEDIPGFHEGLSRMRNGGKATFIIPSSMAYGTGGSQGISGYTPMRFEVWVTDIANP